MNTKDLLRAIPSVDRLMFEPEISALLESHPRALVIEKARKVIGDLRDDVKTGKIAEVISKQKIIEDIRSSVEKAASPSIASAVNATGVILHTGLGRAVLPEAAREAMAAVASGHSTLEIDRETGQRGSRLSHVEPLLISVTGAESAAAYNNNAAAVFLAINTLAAGKEVIISRGQLVEIGGAFRVPDIISRAGCRLVEVGTTNRTRISDYESAITENTALILRVHPSNFKIIGFYGEASLQELVELGRKYGIPVMDDLGSGALIDLSEYGLKDEPMVQMSVKAGCDLVTFSGDKLLGGPQAGLIVGKKEMVEQCKRNPIARAVRLDKITLAGLEATLKLYLDPAKAVGSIPTLKAITMPVSDIRSQARRLAGKMRLAAGDDIKVEVKKSVSEVGGGSLPGQVLDTWVVTLKSRRLSADDISRHFRLNPVPIFGRIENDVFVLDVRTIGTAEERIVIQRTEQLTSV